MGLMTRIKIAFLPAIDIRWSLSKSLAIQTVFSSFHKATVKLSINLLELCVTKILK